MEIAADLISADPETRIPGQMKPHLNTHVRFDTHAHVFTKVNVPRRYSRLRVGKTASMLGGIEFISRVLLPENLEKFPDFLSIMNHAYSEQTLWLLMDVYDHILNEWADHTIFCVLLMDMDFGLNGGEDSRHSYQMQIATIRHLQAAYPNRILPFLAVDPRRPGIGALVTEAFSSPEPFFGIKIYPSLGYLPSDPELMDLFAVCEKKSIPVTAHCSTALVSTNEKHMTISHVTESGTIVSENMTLRTKKQKQNYFNHPLRWKPVLTAYPQLRLNLAHFGSTEEWHAFADNKPDTWPHHIIGLMNTYEHVYADYSYTFASPKAYRKLAQVVGSTIAGERTLFGSDYYMSVLTGKLPGLVERFCSHLGAPATHKLAHENPKQFLGIS